MLSILISAIDDPECVSKFEQIYNEYNCILFRVALSVTRNHHDAEDALQTALFSIARNVDRINTENPDMLKALLIKITKNAAIDLVRNKSRRGAVIDFDSLIFSPSTEDLSAKIIGDEKYADIASKIKSLPVGYRDVLSLNLLYGLSPAEIADMLNRKRATVRSQLSRGLELLKKILEEAGINDR